MKKLFVIMVLALIIMMNRHARADDGMDMVEMQENTDLSAFCEPAESNEPMIDFGMLECEATLGAANMLGEQDQFDQEVSTAVDINNEIFENPLATNADTTVRKKHKKAGDISVKHEFDTALTQFRRSCEFSEITIQKLLDLKGYLQHMKMVLEHNYAILHNMQKKISIRGGLMHQTNAPRLVRMRKHTTPDRSLRERVVSRPVTPMEQQRVAQMQVPVINQELFDQSDSVQTSVAAYDNQVNQENIQEKPRPAHRSRMAQRTMRTGASGGWNSDSYEGSLEGYGIELEYFNVQFNNLLESFRQTVRNQMLSSCKELHDSFFNMIDGLMNSIVN